MNICKWGPLWYIIVGVRQRRCRSPFDFIFPLLQKEFNFNVHYLAFSLSFCRPPFSLCLLLLPFSPFLPLASLSLRSFFLSVSLFFLFFLVPVLFQLRLGDFLLLFCLFQFPLPSVLSVLFFLLFVLTFLHVFSTFPKLRINFFHIFPLSFFPPSLVFRPIFSFSTHLFISFLPFHLPNLLFLTSSSLSFLSIWFVSLSSFPFPLFTNSNFQRPSASPTLLRRSNSCPCSLLQGTHLGLALPMCGATEGETRLVTSEEGGGWEARIMLVCVCGTNTCIHS